jgi:uncharacterized protein
MDLVAFKRHSLNRKKVYKEFYRKLKVRPPADLDELFHDNHERVFENTDCLQCANCCKTTSPIFYPKDIDRASAHLRMKPGLFTERYLTVDEDNDFVLKTSPCAFLGADNRCAIYESRPAACREYPHTNRKKMRQLLDLTFRNTQVCPAVAKITENILQKVAADRR